MDRIARFIVKRSRIVLVATGLFTLVMLASLFFIEFNADVASFITEGHEAGEEFNALNEKYGSTDTINALVTLTGEGSFREQSGLSALALVTNRMRDVAGVESVSSAVPELNPINGQPLTSIVIENAPEEIIDKLLGSNPALDLLISEDGQHALAIISPGDDALAAAGAMLETEWPAGTDVTLTGNPVIFASVLARIGWFLIVIPPVVVLLLLTTFYANIGDRRLAAISVIPAMLGSAWTFGTLSASGQPVDIVTIIVPIFVIVMGSADGLHFVMHYQEEVERTDDVVERVTTTLRQVGIPMILTSLSTMAGFLSLLVTDVEPIRQLGLFTAVGIGYAGLISFFALPALLSHLTIEPGRRHAVLGTRITAGLRGLALKRWFAAGLAACVIIFGAWFIPQLEVDSDQLFFFKQGDEIRLGFDRMSEVFGAATPLAGEFVFDKTAPATIPRLIEIERELETLPGVVRVFSPLDIIEGLPPEQATGMLSGETATPLGPMVSDDGMRFMLFPGQFETAELQEWLAFAEETPEIRVLTGMPVLWDEIARLILRAQIGSLLAAFGLVFVMLLIAYRRVRETLVSLVPIALTVVALLGFLAASGIQLNLMTAIVSSIVIGVGIDYAIHLVAAIDYARADGPGYVLRAIDKAGRPIAANALGIALGLSALWLSPFKIHPQVSMIMWVSMTVAGLATLTVIPALSPREGLLYSEK
ncbi:MAG: MMPL family transporter [Actinomycetota bacterium]|nr:MMPL family transporter [Actinomycetota bacterium]